MQRVRRVGNKEPSLLCEQRVDPSGKRCQNQVEKKRNNEKLFVRKALSKNFLHINKHRQIFLPAHRLKNNRGECENKSDHAPNGSAKKNIHITVSRQSPLFPRARLPRHSSHGSHSITRPCCKNSPRRGGCPGRW